MFTVEVNADGLNRKFTTLALAARDLNKPLRQFGKYLRTKALERYKAQDFAPLAASTVDKRAQKGLSRLESKLQGDLKRVFTKKLDKQVRDASIQAGLLMGWLGANKAQRLAQAITLSSKSVQNRLSVLAEFQRRHRTSGSLAGRTDLNPLTLKQMVRLSDRANRAISKAIGGPILGKLPNSLVVEVEGGAVTLASRVKQHWTAAHNEGETVGHGSHLPKRETIKLEEEDLGVFEQILIEHHLLPAFEDK